MSWPALLERRRFLVVIVIVWALAYLPHLGTRTLRLEEGRRATPAREMLAAHDFVRPTLYGETYLSKPPLYFWIVAAFGSILGEVTPLATRLPSVLSALGCALLAWRFAPGVLDGATRALAALFVLASSTMLDKGTLGEIDATLCLLVAGALKAWWDGQRDNGQTLASWLLVGVLLGLAGILKGPAGPSIFYLTIVPYALLARRWRQLFTVGHLCCIALSLLPAAAWVGALMYRDIVPIKDLLVLWRIQLGADYASASLADPGAQFSRLARHYTEFPPQVFGMFMPAALWLPFGLWRRWSTARGLPADVRCFLACGVVGPVLLYYVYPESRPRHLMAAFFPAMLLSAMVVTGMIRKPGRWAPRCHRLALGLSWVPMVLGMAGVGLAAVTSTDGLPAAAVALVVGSIWSWASWRTTKVTLPIHGAMALAATASGAALAIWFVANSVIVPWRAPLLPSRVAADVGRLIPAETTVYTTRTFPIKGEGYYNTQFHVAKNLRAAENLEVLKNAAPCIAIVRPDERAELESAGWQVEEIGRFGAVKSPPEVHVIRLSK